MWHWFARPESGVCVGPRDLIVPPCEQQIGTKLAQVCPEMYPFAYDGNCDKGAYCCAVEPQDTGYCDKNGRGHGLMDGCHDFAATVCCKPPCTDNPDRPRPQERPERPIVSKTKRFVERLERSFMRFLGAGDPSMPSKLKLR